MQKKPQLFKGSLVKLEMAKEAWIGLINNDSNSNEDDKDYKII